MMKLLVQRSTFHHIYLHSCTIFGLCNIMLSRNDSRYDFYLILQVARQGTFSLQHPATSSWMILDFLQIKASGSISNSAMGTSTGAERLGFLPPVSTRTSWYF